MPSISPDGATFYSDAEIRHAIEELFGGEVATWQTEDKGRGDPLDETSGPEFTWYANVSRTYAQRSTRLARSERDALAVLLMQVVYDILDKPLRGCSIEYAMSLVPEAKALLAARALGASGA